MCLGCSKEPSHRDGSFEYPQHMFWLRNKKNNFQLRTLIWRPALLFPACPSGQTSSTLWGHGICTAVFSEVRVRVAWCYVIKIALVGLTFLPHEFYNGHGPLGTSERPSCKNVRLSIPFGGHSYLVNYHLISSKFQIWIASIKLSFKFENGFCLMNDNQNGR